LYSLDFVTSLETIHPLEPGGDPAIHLSVNQLDSNLNLPIDDPSSKYVTPFDTLQKRGFDSRSSSSKPTLLEKEVHHSDEQDPVSARTNHARMSTGKNKEKVSQGGETANRGGWLGSRNEGHSFEDRLRDLERESTFHIEGYKDRLAALKQELRGSVIRPETAIVKPWKDERHLMAKSNDGGYLADPPQLQRNNDWYTVQMKRARNREEHKKHTILALKRASSRYKHRALLGEDPRPANDLRLYYKQKYDHYMYLAIQKAPLGQRPSLQLQFDIGEAREKYLFWDQVYRKKARTE
jgi:hypothetical protein